MTRRELRIITRHIRCVFTLFSPIRTLLVVRGMKSGRTTFSMSCEEQVLPIPIRTFVHRTSSTLPAYKVMLEVVEKIKDWQKQVEDYAEHHAVNLLEVKALCDEVLNETSPKYCSRIEDDELRIEHWACITVDEDLGILTASAFTDYEVEYPPEEFDQDEMEEVWNSTNTAVEAQRMVQKLLQIRESLPPDYPEADWGEEEDDVVEEDEEDSSQ